MVNSTYFKVMQALESNLWSISPFCFMLPYAIMDGIIQNEQYVL
ncbi:hypothetical protein DFO70_1146 [Cytobacillus firmus]|uniref:Uncharacterized protein n=2 Tax=Cytobacillus TaxID=2675230 RepID=A0A366JMT2_CYTFI|nr:hypothetical protein DFO70_1146 [Cytobacillus firmus]TDX38458.1 hypothetical protein DFO72_1126 [Cytobacillus oceanisediminis]